MDRYDVSLLAMAVLLVLLAGRVWQLWQLGRKEVKQKNPRQLRPRTPEDCPYCRQEHETVCSVLVRLRPQPMPYAEVKSRRGRPKEKRTEGYCCWNPLCAYYGNRNGRVHALVGDGITAKESGSRIISARAVAAG